MVVGVVWWWKRGSLAGETVKQRLTLYLVSVSESRYPVYSVWHICIHFLLSHGNILSETSFSQSLKWTPR